MKFQCGRMKCSYRHFGLKEETFAISHFLVIFTKVYAFGNLKSANLKLISRETFQNALFHEAIAQIFTFIWCFLLLGTVNISRMFQFLETSGCRLFNFSRNIFFLHTYVFGSIKRWLFIITRYMNCRKTEQVQQSVC